MATVNKIKSRCTRKKKGGQDLPYNYSQTSFQTLNLTFNPKKKEKRNENTEMGV
jgi:hypothetical protein